MRSPKSRNNFARSGGGQRKNFFGGGLQQGFFGAPFPGQLQPVNTLPEFSANHFVNGNFPFFDAHYDVKGPMPSKGTLFISHGVHMKFPPTMTKTEQNTFETDFVKSVHEMWSSKHLLMLAEPGFASYLAEVDVSAHVESDPKDAHTVIDVVKPNPNEKRFKPRVTGVEKKEDSKTSHTAQLDFRDPSIEKPQHIEEADMIQQVGNFDFDSDKINADCKEDIDKIKQFIKIIPRADEFGSNAFTLHLVGRASSQGNADYNQKLSKRRAQTVLKALDTPGLGITISDEAGEQEATESADFRRVNVGVFINNDNKPTTTNQNLAAHEFGHMIGLGDEYIETKPEIPGTRLTFFGDNPTHYDLAKAAIDQEAADELLVQNSKSIMSLGNEVKRGHYAFFVGVLDLMTRPEIEKATGKKDAKWIVF